MGPLCSLLLPVLAVNFVYTCFGVNAIILRKFAKAVNPIAYLTIRVAFAAPLLFLAASIAERAKPARPQTWMEAGRLLLVGLSMAMTSLTGVFAVLMAGASIANVLSMTTPVASLVLAILTKTEPMPPFCEVRGLAKVGGILATVVGAIVLVLGGEKSQTSPCDDDDSVIHYDSHQPEIGAIICVLSVLLASVYFVVNKRFFMKYPRWKDRPISLAAWVGVSILLTFMVVMPAGLILPHHTCSGRSARLGFADLWKFPDEGVYAVEYGTILVVCLAIMLLSWALSRLPASVTSAFLPIGVSEQDFGCVLKTVLVSVADALCIKYTKNSKPRYTHKRPPLPCSCVHVTALYLYRCQE